jgi:hypothetical protein
MIGSIFKTNTNSNQNREDSFQNNEVPSLNKRSSSKFREESKQRKEDINASSMLRFQENLDKQISHLSRNPSEMVRQRNQSQFNGKKPFNLNIFFKKTFSWS